MADKDKNMVGSAVQPRENGENNVKDDLEDVNDVEKINEEEFTSLNDQLDRLNLVLDSLETKNDNIQAELIQLLKSNKEARKQFQESKKEEEEKEAQS